MDDYRAPPGRSVPFGVPPLEFVTETLPPPLGASGSAPGETRIELARGRARAAIVHIDFGA